MNEVTTVGAQFKLQALRVTNMNHQLFENTKLRSRMHGYQQTALNHHLQKPDSFQGNSFSPCIGTTDNQYSLCIIQCKRHRDSWFFSLLIIQVQQWMICFNEVYNCFG